MCCVAAQHTGPEKRRVVALEGGTRAELMYAVHVTYCHRLSLLLSSEDVCKKRIVERYYLGGGDGSAGNLTSKPWNVKLGC